MPHVSGRMAVHSSASMTRPIAAHRSAERIGKFVGFGDGLPKPDQAFFTGADTSHLSIVAAAA